LPDENYLITIDQFPAMDLLRSLPIGLYLDSRVTWLHRLDPRVKLAWLMSFLLTPILANPTWRVALMIFLGLLTLAASIPLRVWRSQLGLVTGFCLLIFITTLFLPDGMGVNSQPRLPADELAFVQQTTPPPPIPDKPWYEKLWPFGGASSNPASPNPAGSAANGSASLPVSLQDLPQPTAYRYVLFQQGRLLVTQRSWELALRLGTLLFTLIYSVNLYLLTTAPEEITAGLENLLQPLQRFKLPVTELILTLTLSLRFIPLVLEEVQNLVRAIRTRAINWKKIGPKGAIRIWFTLADRLLENLFLRAEQVAGAMQVRGFTDVNQHRNQWQQLRLQRWDYWALAGIAVLWSLRFAFGNTVS
jgi:energy-coupling factor transport system permease protein